MLKHKHKWQIAEIGSILDTRVSDDGKMYQKTVGREIIFGCECGKLKEVKVKE